MRFFPLRRDRSELHGKGIGSLILHDKSYNLKACTPANGAGAYADRTEPNTPVNTLGIRRIMFAVTDIDDVVARLQKHGAELVGEVVQYEDMYRLCYLRGLEGIMVALAEQLANK